MVNFERLFRIISKESDNFILPGVILYGCPGTGKTLLAKAVANQTSATFLRVVGSELIQKYLGDGPKMVRELFRVAEEHAPVSIIFRCSLLFSALNSFFSFLYFIIYNIPFTFILKS